MTSRRTSPHGGYGWVPDLPDRRDWNYAVPPTLARVALPALIDLRKHCPPIYDQGQLGSCTAQGIGFAVQFAQMKQRVLSFIPSRLFIYYNERVMEGSVSSDAGASIRDGIKSVHKQGSPPETDWPYDISKFAVKPPAKAYTDAKKDLVSSYLSVNQSLDEMMGCLAEGFPIVLGISVYSSFESDAVASTGIVPLPDTDTEQLLGGHCIAAVGYNNKKRVFIMRNSWGASWGMKGYMEIPYEYLLSPDLASDFWTIRSISEPSV